MTHTTSTRSARHGRRIRTRLSRAFLLALAGPLLAGSLAYAAGVDPVRRGVNDFFKGTSDLFSKEETSTGEFHLSPNPAGQGVLVMPFDDRGPRPGSVRRHGGSGPAQSKAKKPEKTKEKSGGQSAVSNKDHTGSGSDSRSKQPKPQNLETSSQGSKSTDSGSNAEKDGVSGEDEGSDDSDASGSGGDSGGSDDDGSGSDSGGSEDDDSGSDSGQSGGSDSEDD